MHTLNDNHFNCLLTIRNTILKHQKYSVCVEMACNAVIALSMNGMLFLNDISIHFG
jgi:hypothetical protein